MKLTDFLTETGYPVAYFPKLCPLLGGVNPTLFLCQMLYWRGKEASRIGEIYKTQDDIFAETGLHRREQENARKCLRQRDILTERYARLEHRMYYKIHLDTLGDLWREFVADGGLAPFAKANVVQGFVYIVKESIFYKIGCSTRPEDRVHALRTGTPHALDLRCLMQTDDMYACEKALHLRFAAQRKNGEWFALTEDDITCICTEYASSLVTLDDARVA